jgi:hypothetical protein
MMPIFLKVMYKKKSNAMDLQTFSMLPFWMNHNKS